MFTKRFLLFFFAVTVCCSSAFAESKLDLQANDTVRNILERQIGQTVELRLKSGEKIGGKLEKVNEKLAHLSQLTGAEYFDAVVLVEDVSAVVVRAKAK